MRAVAHLKRQGLYYVCSDDIEKPKNKLIDEIFHNMMEVIDIGRFTRQTGIKRGGGLKEGTIRKGQ